MKYVYCVILVLCSFVSQAQTFMPPKNKSVLTEYNDGKLWAYLNENNFVVGITCFKEINDYGKYYQLNIYVKNLSDSTTILWPDSFYVDLQTRKNKISSLKIYTNEEYQKKVKRLQAWTMALYGFSIGLNAGMAGTSTSYSTSYSSVAHHYNTAASSMASIASTNQLLTLGQMMEHDRIIHEQGYLKTTTIHPGEAIVGYMYIKRKKGKVLTVNIPIGKYIYSFNWNVSKHSK